jgi:uncharacterized membrane protein
MCAFAEDLLYSDRSIRATRQHRQQQQQVPSHLGQHAGTAAVLMHEHWIRLAVFVVIVFLFCRLFVVENLGLILAGIAVLALGVYAALLAEVPQLGSGEGSDHTY